MDISSSSNYIINPIAVVFTNERTLITKKTRITVNDPMLIIQIVPNKSGTSISQIKIQYLNDKASPNQFNETLNDPTVFEAIAFSMKTNKKTLLDCILSYVNSLPSEDSIILQREYLNYLEPELFNNNICDIICDGYFASLGAYIGFMVLHENGIFMNQLPFQFSIPTTIRSGNAINRNMFQFLSLALIGFSKSTTGVLLQLILFIQSGLNIWDTAFTDGPIISPWTETRMCMEVISGLSLHTINTITSKPIEPPLNHHHSSAISGLSSVVEASAIPGLPSVVAGSVDREALKKELEAEFNMSLVKFKKELEDDFMVQLTNLRRELEAEFKWNLKKELIDQVKLELYEELKKEYKANLVSETVTLGEDSWYIDDRSLNGSNFESAWNRLQNRKRI
jgi:hypothetical protein